MVVAQAKPEITQVYTFDPDTAFAPFSIRAEGLSQLTQEPAYLALRDTVMVHAFPESAYETDPKTLKEYRKAAGLAIKSLMSLATYEGDERDWYVKAVEKVQDFGLEVYRGQGITLQEPKLIVDAAKRPSGRPARNNPTITTTFVAFAQQLTSDKTNCTNYEHDKLS